MTCFINLISFNGFSRPWMPFRLSIAHIRYSHFIHSIWFLCVSVRVYVCICSITFAAYEFELTMPTTISTLMIAFTLSHSASIKSHCQPNRMSNPIFFDFPLHSRLTLLPIPFSHWNRFIYHINCSLIDFLTFEISFRTRTNSKLDKIDSHNILWVDGELSCGLMKKWNFKMYKTRGFIEDRFELKAEFCMQIANWWSSSSVERSKCFADFPSLFSILQSINRQKTFIRTFQMMKCLF